MEGTRCRCLIGAKLKRVRRWASGRGEWAEGEHPLFWQSVVADAVAERRDELARVLKASIADGEPINDGPQDLNRLLTRIGWTVLDRLYPEAVQAGQPSG